MKLAKLGNWIFGFGLLGWAFFTFVTPFVIKILFTPPVSFGTNCEPAVEWSMQKLVITQTIGIVIFMFLGIFLSFYLKKSDKVEKAGKPA